jgi:hypothetical protein
MSILRIRDDNGNIVEIPALRGPQGPQGIQGEQGPQGIQGEQGHSGVYVGSGDMPDGYDVQIDPNGSATDIVDIVINALPTYRGEVENL